MPESVLTDAEIALTLEEAYKGFSRAGLNLPLTLTSFGGEERVSVSFSDVDSFILTGWESFSVEKKLNKLQAWLLFGNDPAVYVSVYVGRDPAGTNPDFAETMIGSIQVRESYRGQQLACRAVKMLEQVLGHTIYSSGHYTPEGFRSLAGKFPYTRQTLERDKMNKLNSSKYDEIGVWFDSMSLVKDWESLTLRERE